MAVISDESNKIIIYTDGSALGNGSPDSGCGWAVRESMKWR